MPILVDNLDRLAQACKVPIKEWRGNCYIIAMTLIACEGDSGELVTGFYHTDDNRISDHAWVEYPDGQIADPTRWTLDNTEPHIYRGLPDNHYDKDGIRWTAEQDEIYKPMVEAALAASRLRAAFLTITVLDNLNK